MPVIAAKAGATKYRHLRTSLLTMKGGSCRSPEKRRKALMMLDAKLVAMSANVKGGASNGAARKYVVKVAKAMERGFVTRDKSAKFQDTAKHAIMAAKSKSKIKSLFMQVKDELISEFQVKEKVANSKLSMYRKSDAMSQQLMFQYQRFHSSTQEVLATKFRTKLVRGSISVVW